MRAVRTARVAVALDGPLESLPGIGPKGKERLAAAGILGPIDLAFALPSRVTRLDDALSVDDLLADPAVAGPVVVRGNVHRASVSFFGRRRTTRVTISGEKRSIVLHFPFHAHAAAKLAVGTTVIAIGAIARDARGNAYVLAPKLSIAPFEGSIVEYAGEVGAFDAARAVLTSHAAFPEAVPSFAREAFALSPHAVRDAHVAGTPAALEEGRRALRIAEVLARGYLARTEPAIAAVAVPELSLADLERAVGVTFTTDQAPAVAEISLDLSRAAPMRRVLLGDVGTGKTLLACAALVACAAAGERALVFAPTAALVDQWAARLRGIVLPSGATLRLRVVTQEHEGAGDAWDVTVGTHALVHRALDTRPALLVVDEPQRTGTRLRDALVELGNHKGSLMLAPHLLLLTATPLPRTLALADEGALATSELTGGSSAENVATRLVGDDALEATAFDDARLAIARHERVFVVAARIAKGAAGAPGITDVKARVERALPDARVELVHAGLTREAQREALDAFREGRCDVLVSTSVVEVGLDVPEATRMIVLSAERFGASQLHQLRGRVGRGDRAGVAWLAHGPKVPPAALARLRALTENAKGLAVARADLEARGPGESLGTAQSGHAEHVHDPVDPATLDHALARLLAEDPHLEGDDARGFRHVVARVKRGLRFEAAG